MKWQYICSLLYGYFHIDPTLKTQTYDDSVMIYDLHKMSKLIFKLQNIYI